MFDFGRCFYTLGSRVWTSTIVSALRTSVPFLGTIWLRTLLFYIWWKCPIFDTSVWYSDTSVRFEILQRNLILNTNGGHVWLEKKTKQFQWKLEYVDFVLQPKSFLFFKYLILYLPLGSLLFGKWRASLSERKKPPLSYCMFYWLVWAKYIYIYIFTGHVIAIEGKHFHAVTNAILCARGQKMITE